MSTSAGSTRRTCGARTRCWKAGARRARSCSKASERAPLHATQKVYERASHGMCVVDADRVNADLLAFLQS
ncbi:hypothetical protein CFB35_29970 [Burkholderia sp. AU16482]|nr:hypothetical protein CFB35_29970 [Burkholderia sp. AU16482]